MLANVCRYRVMTNTVVYIEANLVAYCNIQRKEISKFLTSGAYKCHVMMQKNINFVYIYVYVVTLLAVVKCHYVHVPFTTLRIVVNDISMIYNH